MVIIKSTQNGISEYALLRAIGHAIQGKRVFYVLPTFDLVKRQVDERLTKSIQNTPYYKFLVKAVKDELGAKQAESVKSKDIGDGNITFANSFSRIAFTEYPADEGIIDELDECDQKNIQMVPDRLGHSDYRRQLKISNPTFKNFGIDTEYNETDQMEWHIKCPIGHDIVMDWFKHVVKKEDDGKFTLLDKDFEWDGGADLRPVCHVCGRPVDRFAKGIWVPKKQSRKRGYRLTKLFSGNVTMVEILDRFVKGMTNDAIMQRFYNADLGEAFTADGSKITRDHIINCVEDYQYCKGSGGVVVAGIDVGVHYHFVIKELKRDSFRTLYIGKVKETKELIRILKEYGVVCGVIDAMPETREARKIASEFKLMFLCYFGNVKKDSIDLINKTVTVQRTPAMDAVKESLLTRAIKYPYNVHSELEFIEHLTAPIRVYNPDKKISGTQGVYEWIEGNSPDHYFLATTYALISKRLIVLLSQQ